MRRWPCSGAAIEQIEPDLMLIDIQMPSMDLLEELSAVGPDGMPQFVFVTAYDQFALRAFEVHTLDYVLNGFSRRAPPSTNERFHYVVSM